jgi:gas vesicle protein
MNNFFKGILVGVGVGLLVAPMRGEEMRTLLSRRLEEIRGYLPENEQLNQYTQQVTNRVSQTAGNLKGYAQQAATTLQDSANTLGTIAQNAALDVKQTSQDVADKAKQAVAKGASFNSTSNNSTTAPFTSN